MFDAIPFPARTHIASSEGLALGCCAVSVHTGHLNLFHPNEIKTYEMLYIGVDCGQYLAPQKFANVVPALWTRCNPIGFAFLRRVYSHHSHQPDMAHQDSSAAGCQVSRWLD